MEILKYVICLLLLILFPASGRAEKSLHLQEKEIQAGLLYNFIKYTQWPEAKTKEAAILICIIGNDPFDGQLAPLGKRTVNRHSIRIENRNDMGSATECHVAVIGGNSPDLRELSAQNHILTVSTEEGFSKHGGMIEFGRSGQRISVMLNTAMVQQAGLDVASRLLKLVTIVKE